MTEGQMFDEDAFRERLSDALRGVESETDLAVAQSRMREAITRTARECSPLTEDDRDHSGPYRVTPIEDGVLIEPVDDSPEAQQEFLTFVVDALAALAGQGVPRDVARPDTSKPYPLDALLGRIDEVTGDA